MPTLPTPKTYEEVRALTDKAVNLAKDIIAELGVEGGWSGLDLENARENATELRGILSALWRWAK